MKLKIGAERKPGSSDGTYFWIFFGLNPTTWQNYQPRPTNHVQSTAQVRPETVLVVISGPMKTDKSLQKRDERTKVTESRDLFVT